MISSASPTDGAHREATGKPLDYEARLRRGSDGVYRWFLIRARPLRDKRGKIVKWCGAATDIEDRKRAEQLQAELTHASRLSTMGELVASISHELAQPITVTTAHAKASLRWLQRDPPDLAEVRKGTERIMEAGTLASEIINRLRSLYKKSPPKRELVATMRLSGKWFCCCGAKLTKHGVSIRIDLAIDLPTITADRVQLQQVLMNLMLNGIEAMKETGGVLTVKSQTRRERSNADLSQRQRSRDCRLEEGGRNLQRLRHHETSRERNGAGDQPFHRGIAWWPFVGHI